MTRYIALLMTRIEDALLYISSLSNLKYIIIASIVIIIYPISCLFKISLSIDLLYWTFSTTAQAFVALGALFGMIAVFKLQITNNKIETLSLNLKDIMVYFRGIPAFYYFPEDTIREGNKIISEPHGGSEGQINTLKSIIPILENKLKEVKRIKSNTIIFVKKVLDVVLYSLVFLAMAPLIKHYYLDLSSVIIIIAFSIILIMSVVNLISDVMET